MAHATKWGKKHTCFKCACKFYDLNRPSAICPKCGADQAERFTLEDEEYLEEELLDEDKIDVDDDEEAAEADDSLDEEMPSMQEELGYDETDEEE